MAFSFKPTLFSCRTYAFIVNKANRFLYVTTFADVCVILQGNAQSGGVQALLPTGLLPTTCDVIR